MLVSAGGSLVPKERGAWWEDSFRHSQSVNPLRPPTSLSCSWINPLGRWLEVWWEGWASWEGSATKIWLRKSEILTIPFSLELLGNASNLSLDCLRGPETWFPEPPSYFNCIWCGKGTISHEFLEVGWERSLKSLFNSFQDWCKNEHKFYIKRAFWWICWISRIIE